VLVSARRASVGDDRSGLKGKGIPRSVRLRGDVVRSGSPQFRAAIGLEP